MNRINIVLLQAVLRQRLYPRIGVSASIGGGWIKTRSTRRD